MGVALKTCSECGKERDYRHFYADSTSPDGRRSECKFCTRERREQKREKWREERVERVEKKVLDAMDALCKTSNVAAKDVPHLTELLESIFSSIGGAPGFAMFWLEQFHSTKPGSAQRLKLLEMLVRMNAKASEAGYIDQPLSDKDDEELKEEKKLMLRQLAQQAGLKVVDDDGHDQQRAATA